GWRARPSRRTPKDGHERPRPCDSLPGAASALDGTGLWIAGPGDRRTAGGPAAPPEYGRRSPERRGDPDLPEHTCRWAGGVPGTDRQDGRAAHRGAHGGR